jgi:threonine dehydratase
MTSDLDTRPLTLGLIDDATAALRGVVTRTPLLRNAEVDARLGGRLLIKAEQNQRTGAFKIRGAFNCVRQMTDDERRRGAVTYSSGNHAQGLALAARLVGTSAVIVMPADTPRAKMEATAALGAEIVTYDRDTEISDDVVARIQAETGRVRVPPSGDTRVLAGAATAVVELLDQAAEIDAAPDAVLVPCGGGGLTAATAFVTNARAPGARVYAVEPEAFDDTRRSLAAGERVANPPGRRTICDSIMTPKPNEQTFEINKRLLAGGLVASDDAVRTAMRFAFQHYKTVVEPGAAVGLAAVLSGAIEISGKTVAVFTTGGNVDPERFFDLIDGAPDRVP